MKASVWRAAAPLPLDRGESCGRGAAATAAIAEPEGKDVVIAFPVILTASFFTITVCHKKKKKKICARNISGREACLCKI